MQFSKLLPLAALFSLAIARDSADVRAADASTSIAKERGGDFDLEGWEDLITARHFGLSNSLAAFKNDIVATS
ncbi:hypothetical protein V499_03083 [Pseudogymnoascus sp. VKM F-103]|nr:hypothetical protein V499_03083 [Pseudogymnoascus sp. VKM F-103]